MEEKKNIINGHEAVDLGLSVKWATCNIGATNPEEYGNYFAFGETEAKDEYTEENYMLYGIPHGQAYIDIGKIISGTVFRQQALLIQNIQNIMKVDGIGQVPLVTKIAIGMLCVLNLTLTNSAITALTKNYTKVLLFVP